MPAQKHNRTIFEGRITSEKEGRTHNTDFASGGVVLAILLVAVQFIAFVILKFNPNSIDEDNFFIRVFTWIANVVNLYAPNLLVAAFSGLVLAYVLRSWKWED